MELPYFCAFSRFRFWHWRCNEYDLKEKIFVHLARMSHISYFQPKLRSLFVVAARPAPNPHTVFRPLHFSANVSTHWQTKQIYPYISRISNSRIIYLFALDLSRTIWVVDRFFSIFLSLLWLAPVRPLRLSRLLCLLWLTCRADSSQASCTATTKYNNQN